jgi:hypothetical protein
MQQLAFPEFITAEQDYNAAVAACPGIDPYCSRTDWILPFHGAFTPDSHLHIWREQESFIALAQSKVAENTALFSSVDSLWGFASALVGEESPRMLGHVCSNSLRQGHLILFGLPSDRAFLDAVALQSASTHRAFMLKPVIRCVASLKCGLDGFLSRRTRKFQVNARRALKRAEQAGLQFRYLDRLHPDNIEHFYTRILSVERASWKGLHDEGADKPPLLGFYRHMFERIGPAGMLRSIVAELDGRPVGYIYGGFIPGRFRGLQFSFDDRYRAFTCGRCRVNSNGQMPLQSRGFPCYQLLFACQKNQGCGMIDTLFKQSFP